MVDWAFKYSRIFYRIMKCWASKTIAICGGNNIFYWIR